MLRPYFKGKRIDWIRVRDIEALKAKLCREGGRSGEGRQPKSVNNTLTALSKMLHEAVDLELTWRCVGHRPRRSRSSGHSDLSVTMRYMHLTEQARKAAIALLD